MKRLIVLIVATVIFIPQLAAAYVPSPQYGAFELKFGPYRPNMDEEPGLSYVEGTEEYPYEHFFGSSSMFMTTLELDWQFARVPDIVSFGVGGSWGFARKTTNAVTETGEESSDETSLNVMPFALLGVIRVDVLADKLNIPFVPYYKIGFNWYIWWAKNAGTTESKGGTPGWQMNPGIAFRLDWIDRMSARTFDNEVGVNHSYLFFEYVYARVEGLGKDDHMYLSPTNIGNHGTWMAGLCLEF